MTKYIQNKDTISGKLHDERVMLDIEKGKYFSLNPVAARVWEMLEQPMDLNDLCNRLVKEYEVELNQCKNETLTYLKEMIKIGLIKESE